MFTVGDILNDTYLYFLILKKKMVIFTFLFAIQKQTENVQ